MAVDEWNPGRKGSRAGMSPEARPSFTEGSIPRTEDCGGYSPGADGPTTAEITIENPIKKLPKNP
jgi:hypothetical protein